MTAMVLDTVASIHSTSFAATVESIIANGFATAGDGGASLYARSGSAGPGPGLVQSADGAWWVLASVPVNVLQFGADPTAATSSIQAFNNAIAWANEHGTIRAGTDIVVPDGTYKIDADLTPITASGVYFRGARGAVLLVSATGSVFTWSNASAGGGGGIVGMTMLYHINPASTAVLITISNALLLEFHDLQVSNINTLCVLGTDAAHPADNILFDNVTGNVFNSGQPTFDVRWGAGLTLINIGMSVLGVDVPANTHTSTMTTVANTNFIQFVHGSWDTLQMSGGCNCSRYWHAVYVKAPGSIVQNFWLDDSIFDYCSNDAISLNAPTNPLGAVTLVSCRGSYIVSWSGVGILLTGNNPNEYHDFSGSIIVFAGTHGIQLSGANTRAIHMNNMQIINPNRLATGNFTGIRVDPIAGDWQVIGGSCLSDPVAQLPWSAAFGVDIAADNDRYVIQGANYVGSVANYNVAADTLQSSNRLLGGNIEASYAGFKSGGVFVKPASLGTWINTTPFTVVVTVAGMDLGLGMDVIDLSPLTGGTWDVPPGHSFFVAYSGVSFMHFFVKP